MEPDAHNALLWIAREALKADLPPDWKLCQTPDKDPFYFNFASGQSSWEHPCDDIYKQLFANESVAIVWANVADGLMSASYYAD